MSLNNVYLIGLDSGSTLTKAVIFDAKGHTVGVGHRQITQHHPQPQWVERDMHETWAASAAAIRAAIDDASVNPRDITGVGVTAHGDGLYLLDTENQPLGRGIMSLDSRAMEVVTGWRQAGLEAPALALTGQFPSAFAPNALLGWIQRHQPERFRKIGSILSCKDWLRFCLTGTLSTDFTEASTAFTAVETQQYSREALALFALDSLWDCLPEVAFPTDIVGTISDSAAKQTGLMPGTPVASGLHDVTASAVGLGQVHNGDLTVVGGTFSINEVFSDTPRPDKRWATRNGLALGQWLNMAISPASASNIEWFLQQCCTLDPISSRYLLDRLDTDLDQAFADESQIIYHPFLYGSPYVGSASAAFLGVQGWHKRAHLLRAILEGVVFNHRVHIDALAEHFLIQGCRLTGGGTSTTRMSQLFADTLGRNVEVTATKEAAAFGAALCAGVGTGLYESLNVARSLASNITQFHPDPATHGKREHDFARYLRTIEALGPIWQDLNGGATSNIDIKMSETGNSPSKAQE